MQANDKTVFLVAQSGFGARYLLRTDILTTLKAAGARIVILTPNEDEGYFRREFEDDTVFVERLEVERCTAYRNRSRVQSRLRRIRLQAMGRSRQNTTIRMLRQLYRQTAKQGSPLKWLVLQGEAVAVWLLSHSRLLRRLLLSLEGRLYAGHFHRPLFERYRPHLVVTTSLGVWHPDEYLMREAKAHGAQVVSVILSWDNTTSYGMAAARPDYAVAWTEVMKDELVTYHDVDPAHIFVGGVAHFDLYYHLEHLLSRSELFARLGLDTDRRLILFATKSPNNYPWNPDIVQLLAQAIENRRFSEPCQLVVRPHPIHYRHRNGQLVFQSVLDEYDRLRARYPFVHINAPEVVSETLELDSPLSEMVVLGSLLMHSDVLLNIFSTVALEASIFDLPTIHVAFEGDPQKRRKPRDSIQIDELQVHNQRVVRTGGVRLARDPDQLIEQINQYLRNRRRDAEGRLKIRQQECGSFPGRAGQVIGQFLVDLLAAQPMRMHEPRPQKLHQDASALPK